MIVAGVVFMSVVGFLTLTDVSNAQTNHTGTLNKIAAISSSNHKNGQKLDRLVTQVQDYQKALGMATLTLDQILQEAGATAAQIKADDDAICSATGAHCS